MTVLDTPADVATAVADLVAEALAHGLRSLVLAGGSTPRAAYRQLADRNLDWGAATVLFGDERCVGPAHPDSNFRDAAEAMLDRVRPFSVVRMPGELGAERAADLYEPVVSALQPLDLVLLGIGEDGHTASLFPGSAVLASARQVAPVHGAPKPPPDRVTLTLRALRRARRVVIIATGDGKAEAVGLARDGKVPAGMITGAEWMLDRAAAAGL